MSNITTSEALNALEQCGFFWQSGKCSQYTRYSTAYRLVGNHFMSAKLIMTETTGYSGLGEIVFYYKNKRVGHTDWAEDCADLKIIIKEWARSCKKKYKKDLRACT
jgi:hypothetical protein